VLFTFVLGLNTEDKANPALMVTNSPFTKVLPKAWRLWNHYPRAGTLWWPWLTRIGFPMVPTKVSKVPFYLRNFGSINPWQIGQVWHVGHFPYYTAKKVTFSGKNVGPF